MTDRWVFYVIERPERALDLEDGIGAGLTVLVTGADGSIGRAAADMLANLGAHVIRTDIGAEAAVAASHLDVTDREATRHWVNTIKPHAILHLAGAKHAPAGEEDPAAAHRVNVIGTANMLIAGASVGARVVTASTCKACNPETAYGASKLIAERITLNHGGSVVRFHNVVETQGNVFELWRTAAPDSVLTVAPECERYFITLSEAAQLASWAIVNGLAGRFALHPGKPRKMYQVARAVHPGRAFMLTRPRRGDRVAEPLHANTEAAHELAPGLLRITSPHDRRKTT